MENIQVKRAGLNPQNPALKQATEQFLEGNPARMARAAGAVYDENAGMIYSIFLGRECRVRCGDGQVECAYFMELFDDAQRVLILHNLLTATGRPLTGKLISPREVRGTGAAMIAGLHGITTVNVERSLEENPKKLYRLLETMPGEKANLGDASVCIQMLSGVPVTLVAWAGEDGLIPPALTILMDANVCDYIPPEDVAVLLEIVVYVAECALR